MNDKHVAAAADLDFIKQIMMKTNARIDPHREEAVGSACECGGRYTVEEDARGDPGPGGTGNPPS